MPDQQHPLCRIWRRLMNLPLLYLAALQGIFGKRTEFSRSSITDALFVYLDGEPEVESITWVDSYFRNRPLVCLTKAWEEQIRAQYYTESDCENQDGIKPITCFLRPSGDHRLHCPAGGSENRYNLFRLLWLFPMC